MTADKFTVTADHLKLLRQAHVWWDGMEFGAPGIYPKKPYGNGDVYRDIARLLEIEPTSGDGDFTDEQKDYMRRLHRETETALQIALATGVFEVGDYQALQYTRRWEKVSGTGTEAKVVGVVDDPKRVWVWESMYSAATNALDLALGTLEAMGSDGGNVYCGVCRVVAKSARKIASDYA